MTGTSAGCQSSEVSRRDRAAFGACGVPGPQPWVQPLWRRGGNTQSRALNKSLKSGPFKHKLWPVQRKRISVCIEGSGTENLPPTASSFKALHKQQQDLWQLHWEGKASAELLPSAVFSSGSQGTTASLGFAHRPWGDTCTQGCWQGTRMCSDWHGNETLAQKLKHYHTYDSRIY